MNYSHASRSAELLHPPFIDNNPHGIWTMPDDQDTERFQNLYKRIPQQSRPKNSQPQPLSYIDKTLSMGVQSDSTSLNHKLQNMREKFFKSLTRNYKPTRSMSRERLSNGHHSTNQEYSCNQVDSVVIHHEPNISPMMKRNNFQEHNYQFYGKFDTNPDSQLHPENPSHSMFVSRQSEDNPGVYIRKSQPRTEVENIYKQQNNTRSVSSNPRSHNPHAENDFPLINERSNNNTAYLPTSMSFRANTQSVASAGSHALLTEGNNFRPREIEIPGKTTIAANQKMFVMVSNDSSKQSSPISQGQKLYTSFLKGIYFY